MCYFDRRFFLFVCKKFLLGSKKLIDTFLLSFPFCVHVIRLSFISLDRRDSDDCAMHDGYFRRFMIDRCDITASSRRVLHDGKRRPHLNCATDWFL